MDLPSREGGAGRWNRLPVALCLCAGLGCSGDGTSNEGSGPNVVLYLVDTLRADHLSCYGYERETSPRLDALAEEGVLFENSHSQSNWTQPSVASIITSLPPFSFTNFTKRLPDAVETLAEVLRRNGYRTGGFTTTAAVAESFGFGQGFDVYEESGANLTIRERKRREGSDFDAETLFEMQLPWLREHAGKDPFFLYMHSVDPHAPLTPPEEFDVFGEVYEGQIDGTLDNLKRVKKSTPSKRDLDRLLALYDAEILYNDHVLGRLIDELESLGVLDDTLIVVLSDHGEEFYERGAMAHGHENLHQELTRIPLIMRLPAAIPAGLRVPDLVAGVDIMPTVLSLLRVEPPEELTGRDLSPFFGGGDTSNVPEQDSFSFRGKDVSDTAAVRTTEWLLHADPEEPWELYRLAPDGNEESGDLWSEIPEEQRVGWQQRLQHHMRNRREAELAFRARDSSDDEGLPDGVKDRLQALGYLGDDD